MKRELTDIVIPVHDQVGWADLAVRAVEAFTKNPYRLIVVDSASVEQRTKAWLRDVEDRGHTVIHLAENRSFSSAVNAGVRAGAGKIVVILNDDAMVTEGWDAHIVQDLSEKTVGLVGARSNFAAGHQGDPSLIGEPPFLVFVCVGLRRAVWDAVGPMDEATFDGWSGEDLDYSWRVKQAGYRLKVSNAYVLHAGSRTLAATTGDVGARQRNDAKYIGRLEEKWGKEHVRAKTQLKTRLLIATFHAEEWTRVNFTACLFCMRSVTGVSYSHITSQRAPIHIARQSIADYALDSGQYDYVLMLDDDATFPADIAQRLLRHQKDVVTALAYQRKPPHSACIFELGDDGLFGGHIEGWEETGLRKVDVSGLHCALIRVSVFDRLRKGLKDADGKVTVPGTRQYFGGFDNKVGEDFAFCINLRKLGIPVHCDTDVDVGHMGEPIRVDRTYKRAFAQGQQAVAGSQPLVVRP